MSGLPHSVIFFRIFSVEHHVPIRKIQPAGNIRDLAPLGGGQNDLGSADLDAVLVATDGGLKLTAFSKTDFPHIKAHGAPPHGTDKLSESSRGRPYNTERAKVQVLIREKITQPFLKRH